MKRKALILIISISLISSNIVFATEASENVEIQQEVKSEIQTEEIPSVNTEEQTNTNTDIHTEKLETIENSLNQEIINNIIESNTEDNNTENLNTENVEENNEEIIDENVMNNTDENITENLENKENNIYNENDEEIISGENVDGDDINEDNNLNEDTNLESNEESEEYQNSNEIINEEIEDIGNTEDTILEESIDETIQDDKDVPDLTGLNKEQISDIVDIEEDNIVYEYVIDESLSENTIISQKYEDGILVLTVSSLPVEIAEEDDGLSILNHFELTEDNTDAPSLEDDSWKDYPASYEYNWDNSQNCWNGGMWGGNGNLEGYTTQKGTYDENVRHKMAMYCDGENVHLYIKYASCFGNAANGNDYNFYIDGQEAKFRVVYTDMSDLTESKETGTYALTVLHGNGNDSSFEALGATGTIIVNPNNLNNEMEISIPISELIKQNPNINGDTFSLVEFQTPNLMYRTISCGGADSGSGIFSLITCLFFGTVFFLSTKKELLNGK